jgi:uncharacterized glyoxalase superfamily protein PhnB
MVKPVPEGFHTVTPYLLADGCAGLIDFLVRGLGAVETGRHAMPDGKIMHAQVKIGDSMIMLGDPPPGHPALPAMLYVYVADADALHKRALAAGAKLLAPVADQFYGDRSGAIEDPRGNKWWIATHREDVAEADLAKRAGALKK